jgi:hypothetical protein
MDSNISKGPSVKRQRADTQSKVEEVKAKQQSNMMVKSLGCLSYAYMCVRRSRKIKYTSTHRLALDEYGIFFVFQYSYHH